MKTNKKIKIIFRYIRLAFYIIFFLSFIIIPTSFFEKQSICIIYNVTSLKCPTCGVTRAFSSIMHLDYIKAFNLNPVFTIMICPIFLTVFIQDMILILRDLIKRKDSITLIEYLFKI